MKFIVEGIDAAGKTTLIEKVLHKYKLSNTYHSTSKTANDLAYHLNMLNLNESCALDRFHFGEGIVYPTLYNRIGKLSIDDFKKINAKIVEDKDILVCMVCSDLSIINKRLIERGELNYLNEMPGQNTLFMKAAQLFREQFPDYENFYLIDVAQPNAYEKLDNWIDERFNKEGIR